MRLLLAVAVAALAGACGGQLVRTPAPTHHPLGCDGPCPASKINHLVVIVQENHSFDSYFGRYCSAATGSAPACNDGPACCEAASPRDPTGAMPIELDDAENGDYDPNHEQACELSEIHGGKMDQYTIGGVCSDPRNFTFVSPALIQPYWRLAQSGALADRYFQPLAGQSSSNDMYFARAQFVFKDNAFAPAAAVGQACGFIGQSMEFAGPTIGDLLSAGGVSWSFYAEGYQAMLDAQKTKKCPPAPAACRAGIAIYPCTFDPSDIAIDYYASTRDDPRVLRDYGRLASDLSSGSLPQVVFVRALGYRSEHPGLFDTISDGVGFVQEVVDAVGASDYAADTLLLLTWDEGGGFFDHVAPPPSGSDGQPYGTRIPLVAMGPFARPNFVSHVTMEHSSIVKFIEWNWLGQKTGQLGGRDADVANLGSLLAPAATGASVPSS